MQDTTITCRLVKVELETGEKEILCTSLTDTENYLHEEFDSLQIRKQYKKALEAFGSIVEKTREIIRPGRNEPRNMKPKRFYSMNYKQL